MLLTMSPTCATILHFTQHVDFMLMTSTPHSLQRHQHHQPKRMER